MDCTLWGRLPRDLISKLIVDYLDLPPIVQYLLLQRLNKYNKAVWQNVRREQIRFACKQLWRLAQRFSEHPVTLILVNHYCNGEQITTRHYPVSLCYTHLCVRMVINTWDDTMFVYHTHGHLRLRVKRIHQENIELLTACKLMVVGNCITLRLHHERIWI